MNSPHCTFFEHLLLLVSSTTNALPRRLLLFRQDGNHIQKCPFVSRASCVTFSVQQPFHQTRNKKINLSWSAYSIVRIVYVVSCQTKNIHILSRFQIFCTIYIWGGGIKNILQFQFLLFQRQSKNCQHNAIRHRQHQQQSNSNKIIWDEYSTGHQQSSEVYRYF